MPTNSGPSSYAILTANRRSGEMGVKNSCSRFSSSATEEHRRISHGRTQKNTDQRPPMNKQIRVNPCFSVALVFRVYQWLCLFGRFGCMPRKNTDELATEERRRTRIKDISSVFRGSCFVFVIEDGVTVNVAQWRISDGFNENPIHTPLLRLRALCDHIHRSCVHCLVCSGNSSRSRTGCRADGVDLQCVHVRLRGV